MTYASKQLAEALQQLVREAGRPHECSKRELPVSIETKGSQFPAAVTDFLEKTNQHKALSKAVNVGIY